MAEGRCRALSGSAFVQCELSVNELTRHAGNHFAVAPDGLGMYWFDTASVSCSCGPDGHARPGEPCVLPCDCPPGGHTLTGTCLPSVKKAREAQVGGDHYRKHKIQPWDIWQEYGLNAFEGAIIKYLLRRKGSRLEDLKKARHTLDRLIELEEAGDGE